MMKLDKSLSALFSEQKMRIQAKKDEKAKLQKERTLLQDFRIKVTVWAGRVWRKLLFHQQWLLPPRLVCRRCWTWSRCSWPGRVAVLWSWVWWSLCWTSSTEEWGPAASSRNKTSSGKLRTSSGEKPPPGTCRALFRAACSVCSC